MAITLQKTFSIDLGLLVDQAVANASSVKRQNAAKIEADFQKAVAEGTMDYASQIKLREDQLKKERDSFFSDEETKTSLETSIKSLKKLARFENIRNKYRTSLDDYIQNKDSMAAHITMLENTLGEEVDPTMRTELSNMLTEARNTQSTIEVNAIKNRATLADKDRSIPLIEQSMKEITQKQAQANATGNEDEAAAWGETLITLKQSKSKIQVENASNEINFKISKYNLKASEKIGIINDEISKAEGAVPIIIDGTQYPSQKAFWEQKRNDYMSTTYFDELSKEIEVETNRIKSISKYGQVPAARIESVSKFYNDLKSKPEFAAYAETIEQKRQATVSTYATDLADSIQREFDASEQSDADVLKAEQSIANIEGKFNVQLSRLPFVAAAKEATIADTLNKDLSKVTPLKGDIKKAQLFDPKGNMKEVTVGSYEASQLQSKGWTLQPTTAPTKEATSVAANTPTKKAEGTNTLKAYDEKGSEVYVTPGKYYRGVSLVKPVQKETVPTPTAKTTPTPTPTTTPTPAQTPTPVEPIKTEPSIITLKKADGQTMQVPKGDTTYWNKQGWN